MHPHTHAPAAAHTSSALPSVVAVGKNPIPIRQVFRFVPLEGVGKLVQDCLRAGMKKVSVVPNRGGGSCTLTIEF